MTLFTSSRFASSAASGTDWRDTAKKVLQQFEENQTKNRHFNIGFLYISDHLSNDASSILNLFKSVLGIDNWVGTVGVGVCGCDASYVDVPAISAMVGHIPDDEFFIFNEESIDSSNDSAFQVWLNQNDPMLVLSHQNPLEDQEPLQVLHAIHERTGGFIVGGVASSRHQYAQFSNDRHDHEVSGLALSPNIPVATTLSQGCKPFGPKRIITKSSQDIILEIDDNKAFDIFEKDLNKLAENKAITRASDIVDPQELENLLKGNVHAALNIEGSDQNDYLVRHIMGADPDSGSIAISQNVQPGDPITFVFRNDNSIHEDLSATLLKLRKRIEKDHGYVSPVAGLYVSCAARGIAQKNKDIFDEIALIREIIGEIPLAGFYAAGEISNGRLYGYTGILTLLL